MARKAGRSATRRPDRRMQTALEACFGGLFYGIWSHLQLKFSKKPLFGPRAFGREPLFSSRPLAQRSKTCYHSCMRTGCSDFSHKKGCNSNELQPTSD